MAAKTAAPAKSVTIEMVLEKETKGALRFADTTEGSVLPTLYIRKDAFEDASDWPVKIKVTVEVA